jgi:hypothetical protein
MLELKMGKINFLYLCMYMFVSFMCLIVTYNTSTTSKKVFFILGVVCVIELVAFIWINAKICGQVLNFASLFVIILFIFNYGQVIMLAFFQDNVEYVRLGLLFSSSTSFSALRLINFVFVAICQGVLIMEVFPIKAKKEYIIAQTYNVGKWKEVSKIIIYLTFPIKVGIDFTYVSMSITQGFVIAKTWLDSFPNVITAYGNISLIGIAMLVIVLKDNPRKQIRIFTFIILYFGIIMMSGIRSENVAYVCVFVLLFISSREKKINLIKRIILGIMALFFLAFLIAVAQFRNVSQKGISSFMEVFSTALLEKNVIFSALEEYGNTAYTAICVIVFWLEKYPLAYGKSYLLGLSAIFPSIFGVAGQVTRESHFALKLQEYGALTSSYKNIGGSVIGELFYNFGIYGGIIAALFLGLFIGYISKNVDFSLKNNRYEKIIYYIPVMFGTIYWIRDYFGGRIRECVWGVLFCFIIIKLIEKRNARVKNSIVKRR